MKTKRWWMPVAAAVCVVLAVTAVWRLWAQGPDTDEDGMSDAYETFFGLNPTNAADAALDPDGEGLVNLQESLLWTDPWQADTDRDGFEDDEDSNALSRVFADFTAPYATNSAYTYTGPAWWLGIEKTGGLWDTNPPSWRVDASDTNPAVGLYVDLDRALLTNDVVISLEYIDSTNGTLYVDLSDTNDQWVATDLYGNLLTGTGAIARSCLAVPLASNAAASAIYLRRGSGEVRVNELNVYIDLDGDGLDADQELQLGASDTDADSDDDGINDWDEVFLHGTNPADADSDDDGLDDGEEVASYGTDPLDADTDDDGLADGWEVANGFDPAGGIAASHVAGSWKLDEESGATAYDSSTNANNGTISGAIRIVGGRGNALQFDGQDDLVSIANDAAYKPAALTVACLARFDAFYSNAVSGAVEPGTMMLLCQPNASNGCAYALYKTPKNALVFESAAAASGVTARAETHDDFVAVARWYHIVATIDPPAMALYVDGALVASAADAPPLEYDGAAGLTLGTGPVGQDAYLAGALDEVLVADFAVDAATAASLGEALEDEDADRLSNLGEAIAGSGVFSVDTEGDGLRDDEEVETYNTNPNLADSDSDGLSDWDEVRNRGTDPTQADSDGDGFEDGEEIDAGTDPLDGGETPGSIAGTVAYSGGQTGTIVVLAAASSNAWTASFSTTIAAPGAFQILNVPGTSLWVKAYRDSDGNATNGPAEACGAAAANPIAVTGAVTGVSIVLADPDTDADELPDFWELEAFGDLDETASGDPDDDGLSNAGEYAASCDPLDPDTDADGLEDGEEVDVYGTSAALADTDADGTNDLWTVATRWGTNSSHRTGTWLDVGLPGQPLDQVFQEETSWLEDGTTLYATNIARVEYAFEVPKSDMYRFGLKHTNLGQTPPGGYQYRLLFLVDQVLASTQIVDIVAGTSVWHFVETPWLGAGAHTLRLWWVNAETWSAGHYPFLAIEQVTLEGIDGADTNANGRQDWVEAVLLEGKDTDEDGLTDEEEVAVYGTDPVVPDTDGDALLDGEEVSVFGTDPVDTDSDDDGNSDAVLLEEQDASEYTARAQSGSWKHDWYTIGSDMMIKWDEGELSYRFAVTNAAMYRLAVQARGFRSEMPDNYRYQVEVEVDGTYIGTAAIAADIDFSGIGYVTTPWMCEGDHTFLLRWVNAEYFWDPSLRDPNYLQEKVALYAVGGPDTNANGRADWMDAALAANGDSDGDGVSDLDEIDVYGSNPLLVDSDYDGLTDGEEVSLGTAPADADSDGDGVNDGVEAQQAFTNPLDDDFDGAFTNLSVLAGSAFTNAIGAWDIDGTHAYARDLLGTLDYGFCLATSGTYAVQVEAAQHNPLSTHDLFDLTLYVDGIFSGRQTLRAPQSETGTALFFLPHLPAGSHSLRLQWRNFNDTSYIEVIALRIRSYGGPDADSNGLPDWLDARLANVAALPPLPATSLISPVCLEGQSRFLDMVCVGASYVPPGQTTQVVSVDHGVDTAWYADVLLSPTNATAIQVADQSGLITFATSVVWQSFNILDPSWTNDVLLRDGDSLLLTALPDGATNGSILIDIPGVTNYSTSLDAPVAHLFETGGYYTVYGMWTNAGTNVSATIHVLALDGGFPGNPACVYNQERNWQCPGLPDEAVIEHDQRLYVVETDLAVGRRLEIRNSEGEPLYMVARVGEDGPILDNARVDCVQIAQELYWEKVGMFPDGSELIRLELALSYVPDDLGVSLSIFVGGVTFDDGTISRNLTAADFNELGTYTYYFIKDPAVTTSTCHTTALTQSGVFIGGI